MTEADKQAALSQIASIAAAHGISADEISAAMREPAKTGLFLNRVLGYLGGIFIFGGLLLFTGMQWNMMGSEARVIITYGSGLVAFVLGLMTLGNERYRLSSTPLFIGAAALIPTGMFVFLSEYSQGGDEQLAAMVVFALTSLQFMAAFFRYRRSSLLFFGYFFYNAALVILLERTDMDYGWIGILFGLSTLMVCSRLDQGPHRAIVPFWYFVAGAAMLISAFDLLEETPLDIALLVLSAAMMSFSVRMQSRALLIVSTIGLFSFLCYYTYEYFADITGWPIALIFIGLCLVGISAYAVNLGRKIKPNERKGV